MIAILIFAVYSLLNPVSCHLFGTKREKSTNVGIYGGHQIPIELAPYMASLHRNIRGKWKHHCGASIIHEQFLLTAAHCLKEPADEHKALVGTNKLYDDDNNLLDIEEVIIHELFSPYPATAFDVALVKLKEPLTFGPKVGKITLATSNIKVPIKSLLNTTGWGFTEAQEMSTKLLQVEVPKIGQKKCEEIFAHIHKITPDMICAGSSGHDSCGGDSGGPLTLGNVQVGITSFGKGCGDVPGVYTKVSAVVCWIMEKIYSHQ